MNGDTTRLSNLSPELIRLVQLQVGKARVVGNLPRRDRQWHDLDAGQRETMFEPFRAGQVRCLEDGERCISYGTSSYGYDIRCSDEFKIFTNINSAVVDPKNFDSSSFVNLQSDVCIIPLIM